MCYVNYCLLPDYKNTIINIFFLILTTEKYNAEILFLLMIQHTRSAFFP